MHFQYDTLSLSCISAPVSRAGNLRERRVGNSMERCAGNLMEGQHDIDLKINSDQLRGDMPCGATRRVWIARKLLEINPERG